MIDIAMLSCNRSRITAISILEIARRTTTPYRLIVLDNGSEDDSVEILGRLYQHGLIQRLEFAHQNNGVHWGFNQLLGMVTSEPFYVCTDNDIVPSVPVEGKDWLERLTDLAYRNYPVYGAISCRPHVMIGEPRDRFDDSPEIREMSHVGAVLRLMQTDLARQIGGWRSVIQPSRNNEEWFICGKMRKAGHKVGYARDIRVIHLFGEGDDEDPWGYPPGVEHGHRKIWPPVNHSSWSRMRIDWGTCE